MINSKDYYSEEEYNASLQHINENIEEIKQHLLDDSMVVKKKRQTYRENFSKLEKSLELSDIR